MAEQCGNFHIHYLFSYHDCSICGDVWIAFPSWILDLFSLNISWWTESKTPLCTYIRQSAKRPSYFLAWHMIFIWICVCFNCHFYARKPSYCESNMLSGYLHSVAGSFAVAHLHLWEASICQNGWISRKTAFEWSFQRKKLEGMSFQSQNRKKCLFKGDKEMFQTVSTQGLDQTVTETNN